MFEVRIKRGKTIWRWGLSFGQEAWKQISSIDGSEGSNIEVSEDSS